MQISPRGLTFAFIYLPNGSGTTRSPGLVHINPNGLPGHGLSDSRVVFKVLSEIEYCQNLKKLDLSHLALSLKKNLVLEFY